MADVESQIDSLPEHQPASTAAERPRPAHASGTAPRLTSMTTTANPQTTNATHPRPPNIALSPSQANDPPVNVPTSLIAGNQGTLIFPHFRSL